MQDPTPADGPQPPAATPRIDRLTTFDCFDTVITRAVGDPDRVAYLTGRRLHAAGTIPVSAERYAEARRQAERLVQRGHGDDGTLDHIAAQLAELLSLPPQAAGTLRDAELAMERELTREVPGARRRVQAARASGSTVGFLSDTPLPHPVVADLLGRGGLLEADDLLWVSNELGAGKGRGTAYPAVVRRLGAAPAAWTHLGDDARADVRNARLCGLEAVHLTGGRLDRYEKCLERDGVYSGGLASVMAGASRRTRLTLAADRPDVPAGHAGVAAGVAGPLLAGYVLWCLQQAQAAGCRRLYFVARGGEVLVDMARRLAAHLDLDIDLRYLYGSRKAWMLPATARARRDFLLAVAGREDRVTVHSTLSWFSVPPEDLAGPLAAAGFPPASWDQPLGGADLERLAGVVEDPAADAVLAERTRPRREAAAGYLRQVGLLDGEPFGIVDMTGRGTTGRFLTDTLRGLGGQAPAVELYFGLEPETPDADDRSLRAWMFDDRRRVGMTQRDVDLWVPLEAFTQARHGHVQRYERAGDGFAPVLAVEVNDTLVAWGLDGFRDALATFCDELGPALHLVDAWGDVRRPTWESLRTFWLHPSAQELADWQDFPLEDDAVTYPMGRGYTGRQVLGTVLAGRPRVRPRGTWPAAVQQGAPAGLRVARAGADLASSGLHKARRVGDFLGHRRGVRPGS